jgi:hypothetical protein
MYVLSKLSLMRQGNVLTNRRHNKCLFADDTSIRHTAHDENTLKNMINIDLKYIQKDGL